MELLRQKTYSVRRANHYHSHLTPANVSIYHSLHLGVNAVISTYELIAMLYSHISISILTAEET